MKRSYRRWLALARARWARAINTGKRAVLTDADVTVDTREAELAEAESFARSAESMRGGVAKLGQLRAYFDGSGFSGAGADARARLGALWDRMPGAEPARIRRVLVEDLGAEPEALFARWDDAPLAAASLGQVHAAESADGARLAVKVQYPEVAEALRDDLASRAFLRRIVGGELGAGADGAALERLRAQLLAELDYRAEAANLERFRAAWSGDPRVVVPRAVAARSSARVLTMERLDGAPLSSLAERDDAARNDAAATLFRFAFGSPLLHGLVNCDPHPGNYLVLDGRIGFVDFGSVTSLADELRAAEQQLWRAIIVRDGESLRHAVHLEGLVARAEVFESAAFREWERALAEPFLARGAFTLTPAHARRLVALTAELARGQRLALPAGALLLWRQRLGALTVIASLRPTLDFRRALAALLDDHHPIPLADRYR